MLLGSAYANTPMATRWHLPMGGALATDQPDATFSFENWLFGEEFSHVSERRALSRAPAIADDRARTPSCTTALERACRALPRRARRERVHGDDAQLT